MSIDIIPAPHGILSGAAMSEGHGIMSISNEQCGIELALRNLAVESGMSGNGGRREHFWQLILEVRRPIF